MKRCLFYCVVLLAYTTTYAQLSERIETDRPDEAESPFITPKRFFQGEFGMNVESYQSGTKQFLHPTSLLKYGLSNRLELRLEADPFTMLERFIPDSKLTTLLPPIEVGGKVRVFEEAELLPKTSIIFMVSVPPVASRRYRAETLRKDLRLALQNTLAENVFLGYNVAVETGDETTYSYAFAPGLDLGEKWHLYAELFGDYTASRWDNKVDGGITFFPTKNTKLDLSTGFGLGNSELKNYVAIGFSFRIKTSKG